MLLLLTYLVQFQSEDPVDKVTIRTMCQSIQDNLQRSCEHEADKHVQTADSFFIFRSFLGVECTVQHAVDTCKQRFKCSYDGNKDGHRNDEHNFAM